MRKVLQRLHGHISSVYVVVVTWGVSWREVGEYFEENWYSGGTIPLAGLIIRARDIEKAISDSGNHNLPEVELENIDGVCMCGCVCVR